MSNEPNLFNYRRAAGGLWLEDIDTSKREVTAVYASGGEAMKSTVIPGRRRVCRF